MRTPEKPIISIVVPCLNRADFLIPTIESVLQQEYPNIECIVIDGGSTDGTIELLKRYDGRIKWISESDSGHADAINKGWKMSKGEILVWLNADDIWAPQAVNNAVTYLEKHPEVDVVYGSSAIIDKDGNIINLDKPLEWNFDAAVKYCYYFIPQSSSFIRRRILEKISWFDDIIGTFINKTGKDRWLWLRIALAGGIIKISLICYLIVVAT